MQPTTLIACEADIGPILDTTDLAALSSMGFTPEALAADEWRLKLLADHKAPTRRLAERLKALGYAGLQVRSFAKGAGIAGILIAMAGGSWLALQGGAPSQPQPMAAVTLFLAGMGPINPIGTAIALEPFGDRAGIASALLGFLQMACAAIGTAIIGALPVGPATAFAWIVFGGTILAGAAFFPVLRTGRSEQ